MRQEWLWGRLLKFEVFEGWAKESSYGNAVSLASHQTGLTGEVSKQGRIRVTTGSGEDKPTAKI